MQRPIIRLADIDTSSLPNAMIASALIGLA